MEQAHEYRVLHEWDRLKATLNNIALLQPHFDKVWEHQAHNLAYNVSTEFDDYRQRYEMVREGTEFLSRGVATKPQCAKIGLVHRMVLRCKDGDVGREDAISSAVRR